MEGFRGGALLAAGQVIPVGDLAQALPSPVGQATEEAFLDASCPAADQLGLGIAGRGLGAA